MRNSRRFVFTTFVVLIFVAACGSFSSSGSSGISPDAGGANDGSATSNDASIDSGGDPSDADGKTDAKPTCDGGPPCPRYVFVTSLKYPGSLGGVVGADEKCRERAAAGIEAIKNRKFRAWIATTDFDNAKTRFQPNGPFILTNGAQVAGKLSDFNNPVIAISRTELGLDFGSNPSVWTGANADGTPGTYDCDRWQSGEANAYGQTGKADKTDSEWTAATLDAPCNDSNRLYCFEE